MSNFKTLSCYVLIDEDSYDKNMAQRELDFWIENPNDSIYNLINYEKLIFFELHFPDDIDIQTRINILKEIISKNYIMKKKFINHLSLSKN